MTMLLLRIVDIGCGGRADIDVVRCRKRRRPLVEVDRAAGDVDIVARRHGERVTGVECRRAQRIGGPVLRFRIAAVTVAARTVAVDGRGRLRRLERHVAIRRNRPAAAEIDIRARRRQVAAHADLRDAAHADGTSSRLVKVGIRHTVRARDHLVLAGLHRAEIVVAAHGHAEVAAHVQPARVLLEVAARHDRGVARHVEVRDGPKRRRGPCRTRRANLVDGIRRRIEDQVAARVQREAPGVHGGRGQVDIARRRQRHEAAALQRTESVVDLLALDRERIACLYRTAVIEGLRVLQIDVGCRNQRSVHVLLARLREIDDRHEDGLPVNHLGLHDDHVAGECRHLVR
ncbi:hypothetical protein LMG28614_06570 [Paraburkholderia ultramafica]|uniref:Uncharacterized protein n=1 Tax=Paraburkholderia ultramafica TaxID=1544867 RepID=A0A6S7DHK7_9BURK|nr:hypothetical protein LMG28614_06570 [Paraburkholderia ultramafica]